MRYRQQIFFADSVRSHRQELADLAAELEERTEPLTPLEARLVLDAADVRMKAIEDALRFYGEKRRYGTIARARARLARVWLRMKSWTKPRIGRLKHYEPRPLRVPAKYLAERPPEAAPVISIVTPSFQQGRYLDRTIYSILRQKYPALEYVVQDGGSTDETLDVLKRFEHLLTRWVSEHDDGQADAVNKGFAATTGEIMAWLNSDDLLLPGSLAYVGRYFADHPDVDVVYGHRLMIDENDGQIGAWILPEHDDLALTLADFVPQETLFWRRRIWEAIGGGVDPDFAYALDWDLLLRFREAGAKMARLPRYLGAFRVHDEQKTTVEDAIGMEEVALLRKRVHGRYVPVDEVLQRLRPYLVRHILIHSWHRFVDRLPLRRVEVPTLPLDPRLRKPEVAAPRVPTSASDSHAVAVLARSPNGPARHVNDSDAAAADGSAGGARAASGTPEHAAPGDK